MAIPDHPQKDQPVIHIIVMGSVTRQVLEAIEWGLEEEGIPVTTSCVPEGAVNSVARQAAQMSKLNVGIAVSQTETLAVLHHRDLPTDRPLFSEKIGRVDGEILRRLGANAARLVKGNPLLFPENDTYSSNLVPNEANRDNDSLKDIVDQVIREVLHSTGKNEDGIWS